MHDLWQDTLHTLRLIKRSPFFASIVVATLALAIGANTAIFSLINAVLLRGLPFPDIDRHVMIWEDNTNFGFPRNHTSPANFRDWREQGGSFEQMAAIRNRILTMIGASDPEELKAVAVSANFFTTLGIAPFAGRGFSEDADRPEGAKVAVVSYGLWQRKFGGSPSIINQSIRLNNEPYTIIGIMPAGFDFPDNGTELWIPLSLTPADWEKRSSHFLRVIGRLKVAVTLDQAQAEMKSVAQRLERQYPESNTRAGITLVPLREQLVGDIRPTLLALMAAVGCVLLIACTNVANLLIVRSTGRKREMALRGALGASPFRLFKQVFVESLVLAVISGAIGLLLAPLTFKLMKTLIPPAMAAGTELSLDPTVLLFTLGVSLLTAVLFGAAPVLHARKVDMTNDLKQGGQSYAGGKSRKAQRLLIVAEVALAHMLLIGAGLMIQNYVRLINVNLGFSDDHIITMRTTIPLAKYQDPNQRLAFFEQVLEKVRALPGVESAAYTNLLPLTSKGGANGFLIEGRPSVEPGKMPLALARIVSRDYLKLMRIPLINGRNFEQTDGPSSHVAIVNEKMVKTFWPGEEALNHRIIIPGATPPDPITIIGVTADVKETGIDADTRPTMYLLYSQFTSPGFVPGDLAVRTKGDAAGMTAAIRRQVWAVDPNQPISRIRTMTEIIDSELYQRRVHMLLLTVLAGIALIQASLGIYGVLTYFVTQQTKEIGLRMALGASNSQILRTVLAQGVILAAVGAAIGVAASFAAPRLASGFFFTGIDSITLTAVSVFMVLIAIIASYMPARRAIKVEPLTALRSE